MKHPKVSERKLGREKAAGQAWKEDKLIEIDPRQDAYDFFETLVHEWYHVEFPDWSERTVAAKSKKQSKFLWKNKVRIIK